MLVQRIGNHDLPLPKQESMEAAGYDLRSTDPFVILPGQRVSIPCGFAVAIPTGMVGLVRPRSGLAVKYGIDIMAGVIDSDYRGELKAVLINHGDSPVSVFPGERIAQLVVVPCLQVHAREVDELPKTERGEGGFGSTGT
jgi:dUTP pyrophosphatase